MTTDTPQTSHMRRAVELARARVGSTGENPAVGCVIVADGRIVAEAATAPGGRPHAEEQALAIAGEAARGAQVFVTLEPCAERSAGGKSCASRLLEAGVAEVIVACQDASPFASGRGTALLLGAGVTVSSGLLRAEAEGLYSSYAPPSKADRERPG